MPNTKSKLRGTCQMCGRVYSWQPDTGIHTHKNKELGCTCPGSNREALELDRSRLDQVRTRLLDTGQQLLDTEPHQVDYVNVNVNGLRVQLHCQADLTAWRKSNLPSLDAAHPLRHVSWDQLMERQLDAFHAEGRKRLARAAALSDLAESRHGQPLIPKT